MEAGTSELLAKVAPEDPHCGSLSRMNPKVVPEELLRGRVSANDFCRPAIFEGRSRAFPKVAAEDSPFRQKPSESDF